MSIVQLNNNRKVFNRNLCFVEFLVGASDDIVRSYISLVDVKYAMTILNCLLKHFFLHERAGSNE